MRKLLVIVATTLLFVMSAMPIQAGAPTDASGTWVYVPEFEFTKSVGNNAFVSGTDVGEWTGTFVGESFEEYVAVFHKDHGTYQGLMTFEGTVAGREGTLVIKTNGSGPLPPIGWSGSWVILSGTGELAGLHGSGSWFGDLPNLVYEGKVHFSR